MESLSGVDLTTQLEIIYGKAVVDDIKKERSKGPFATYKKEDAKTVEIPFSSFEELRKLLFSYLFKTNKTNYYELHPHYTRFVLITLEIFNHDSSNSFINLLTKEVWHIEHIIPQSRKQELKEPSLVNSLGNLSLLTSDVNTTGEYSTADFQIKGTYLYLKSTIEENMFLNKCFKEYSDFSDTEIKIREDYLLEKFYEIFSENIPYTNLDDFSIDSLIEKLNLKES